MTSEEKASYKDSFAKFSAKKEVGWISSGKNVLSYTVKY